MAGFDDGNTLYAWQYEDSPGSWAIIGVNDSEGVLRGRPPMPLVMRSANAAAKAEKIAKRHGQATGKAVRLAKFTMVEETQGE